VGPGQGYAVRDTLYDPRYLSHPLQTAMRTPFFLRTIIGIAVVLCSSFSFGQDAAYRTAVKEYLKATGSMKAFTVALDQMVDMHKQNNTSGLSDSFWNELRDEMALSLNELVDMLAPVYAKHLSITDLNEVTAFYNSPAGKKMAEATPAILQDSMQVGQAWGAEVGARIAKRIEEKRK
jgi:uncharacterized protein